jgi:predicted ArsR family transcriptional regulator
MVSRMADGIDATIAGVALLHDPVRRSLYDFVVAQADPVSREQAAEAVGVQRTLAAFHLDKLAAHGLLDVEFRRLGGRTGPGAGRPSQLYRRSDRELEVSLPPRVYDVAADLLAGAIEDAAGGVDVQTALDRRAAAFGRDLAARVEGSLGARATAAARRAAVLEALSAHGFEPRVEGRQLVLGNCPFHRLAERHPELVCGMNLRLLEGLSDGLDGRPGGLEPRLEPEAGRCCILLRARF